MCIFLIIAAVKNFTPLKIVGLDPEFIFYIIFAFFFGKFKGAFLSFVYDFFNLLLDGKIGFYHEALCDCTNCYDHFNRCIYRYV
ncbi:hypothetical protein ONA21_02095 [Mycoplasmopsis cynos]|nr:hypothetical protein [Mycoplasmopsis cynos]WAM08110.1 hypothetical protein ONA21_02095 [Mycoplasmopsis cynos]